MSAGSSYDPQARRDTPLARKLKALIRWRGPISVRDFMAACLFDPEHGYYRTHAAIGRQGDFVTAPEISQVFGELIGLWAAVVWQQMGSPGEVRLVELGPGRGTLMADALRAIRRVPGFRDALRVSLVEINPTLREAQRAAVSETGVPVDWRGSLVEALAGEADGQAVPVILLANEFADCMPQTQFIRRGGHWLKRRVGTDELGRLSFVECAALDHQLFEWRDRWLDRRYPGAEEGTVVARDSHGWLHSSFLRQPAMAALIIDYGHLERAAGDTLQAVRNHAWEYPLTSPGEADLTMQVDFSAVARRAVRVAKRDHVAVDGPVTQAEFLGALGIVERASRLMAANPAKAGEIEMGVARLMAPQGMGTRFKAIGLRSAHLPPLPGLTAIDKSRVGQ